MIKLFISLWKNVFNLNGTVGRKEFWISCIVGVLSMFLFMVPFTLIDAIWPIMSEVICSICIVPLISLYIRRANDIGIKKNTWIYIAAIIPLLGMMVVLFFPSNKSDNKTPARHDKLLNVLFTIGICINILATFISGFPFIPPFFYNMGISLSFIPVIIKILLIYAERTSSKIKAWILVYEQEIKPGPGEKDFFDRDKHIELTHTYGFMRFIWLVGGIGVVGILNSGGWVGIVLGLLAFVAIKIVEVIATKKISRDLHLIFYTERDEERDVYFAIDIKSNELLYVQHFFKDETDEYPSEVYFFKPVELNFLKQIVKNGSERFYKQIEHITQENIKELCSVQFGETTGEWIRFFMKKENDIQCIGCLTVRREGVVSGKYTELPTDVFEKAFGKYDTIYEKYDFFVKTNFWDSQYECLCYVDRLLNPKETSEFLQIYDNSNNNKNESTKEHIEILFIKDFFKEITAFENATMRDISAMNLLKEAVASE